MTRINLIPVTELTDQHLLAEHREIKRIPNIITSWKYNLSLRDIPEKFCLWTWHVKFFYDKIWFLYWRYVDLYQECLKRWFKVENYWESFSKFIWHYLFKNYKPTQEEIEISRKRIQEKINQKPLFYKYYWKQYETNI